MDVLPEMTLRIQAALSEFSSSVFAKSVRIAEKLNSEYEDDQGMACVSI